MNTKHTIHTLVNFIASCEVKHQALLHTPSLSFIHHLSNVPCLQHALMRVPDWTWYLSAVVLSRLPQRQLSRAPCSSLTAAPWSPVIPSRHLSAAALLHYDITSTKQLPNNIALFKISQLLYLTGSAVVESACACDLESNGVECFEISFRFLHTVALTVGHPSTSCQQQGGFCAFCKAFLFHMDAVLQCLPWSL